MRFHFLLFGLVNIESDSFRRSSPKFAFAFFGVFANAVNMQEKFFILTERKMADILFRRIGSRRIIVM